MLDDGIERHAEAPPQAESNRDRSSSASPATTAPRSVAGPVALDESASPSRRAKCPERRTGRRATLPLSSQRREWTPVRPRWQDRHQQRHHVAAGIRRENSSSVSIAPTTQNQDSPRTESQTGLIALVCRRRADFQRQIQPTRNPDQPAAPAECARRRRRPLRGHERSPSSQRMSAPPAMVPKGSKGTRSLPARAVAGDETLSGRCSGGSLFDVEHRRLMPNPDSTARGRARRR
jgi:hypothetical protein